VKKRHLHIAFVILPNHPYVGPTLPLVSVLVRRGYRVTYVTSDRFASRIAAQGAEVLPCPDTTSSLKRKSFDELLCYQTQRLLQELYSFYEGDRPDLIVYDEVQIGARVLASRWGTPAIQVSPCFALNKEHYSDQVSHPQWRAQWLETSKAFDRALELFGLDSNGWTFFREELNIYLFPKLLQPGPDLAEENCIYVGRCPGEQPYYGNWNSTSAGGLPTVLATTSTNYVMGPDFFRLCIEALSGLGWHLILSVGERADPSILGDLPSNVTVIQHTAHVKILPRVNLLVCLGGIVTSSEAAYHGVPLVVTSHGFPELEWQAENLVRLGIGVHLSKDQLTVDRLRRAATDAFQDERMAQRMLQIQRHVREEPGAEEAVNRIEEFIAVRCP
jgi:MGT family glycosyltransferase